MKKNLTYRDIWHVWVLPVMAALVAAAVLVVERLQVDWTASCSILGATACDLGPFLEFFGWVPVPLAYGAFHIWGARRLTDGHAAPKAMIVRVLATGVFLALHLFPAPGLLLFYVGLAGGVSISLTVVGVVVAPVAGVLAAGFVAGLILGALAWPWADGMPWRGWKALLWGYGLGGALGGALLMLGQVAFDPAFANSFGLNWPWLTAAGMLATVLAVGVITSLLAWRGWIRAGLLPGPVAPVMPTYAWPAALAVLLVAPVHLMVSYELTVFSRNGAPFPAMAAMLRGGKPEIAAEMPFVGLTYIGQRSLIAKRGTATRQRMETARVDRGAEGWVNVGRTVSDRFEEWELYDPGHPGSANITITADQSALWVTYECEPGLAPGEEFCIRPEPVYRDYLNKTIPIAYNEDAFLLSAAAPDAALGIRFDNRQEWGADKRSRPRLYCRLNLTSVTPAKLSAMQIIPCDADWVARARRLRAQLERDFVAKSAS